MTIPLIIQELAVAVTGVGVVWLLAWAYRRDRHYLGEPSSKPAAQPSEDPFRGDSSGGLLTAYHAAFLHQPLILPGAVALAPLWVHGHFEMEGFRMRVVGGPEGLDPFQRLVHDRADGFEAFHVTRSVSMAIRQQLEAELAGSALETPPGGRLVPRATTWAFACAVAGSASVIVAAGGWFGLLGVVAVWLGHKAEAARTTVPGHRLSQAGHEALSQLERWLDARIRGLEVSEYGSEEVAVYTALKPMGITLVPGEGTEFVIHVGPPEQHPPPRPTIGAKLSKKARSAARRTNIVRAVVRMSFGVLVLACGVSLAIAAEPSFSGPTKSATIATALSMCVALFADWWRRRPGARQRGFRS